MYQEDLFSLIPDSIFFPYNSPIHSHSYDNSWYTKESPSFFLFDTFSDLQMFFINMVRHADIMSLTNTVPAADAT